MFRPYVLMQPALASGLLSTPLALAIYLAEPSMFGGPAVFAVPVAIFIAVGFMIFTFTPTGGNLFLGLITSAMSLMVPGTFLAGTGLLLSQTGSSIFSSPWILLTGLLMVAGIGMVTFLFTVSRPTLSHG